ncbi:MAG: site-specific integrase [Bacteroidia bacterium]|nr:site-specific integrase [Bacteroidia bacterium]
MKVAQSTAILFWLRGSTNGAKSATLMVRVTINGKRINWSLGKQVNPEHWLSGAGMLKTSAKESKLVNPYLIQVKADIQSHFNLLSSQNDNVTPEMVRNACLGINKDDTKARTLLEAFEYHNTKFKEKVSSGKLSFKTWQRLDIGKNKVAQFLIAEMKCKDILLSDIKLSFASNFEHFLSVKQKLQSNTTMKYIKIVKQIINYAITLEWIATNPLNAFRCSYTSPDRIVLTQDEINLIYETEMPNTRLEQVRDMFLFSCYTGYAFTDVSLLSTDNLTNGIDGEMWIQTNRVKTDVRETVMLLDVPLLIIEKYKNNPVCKAKGTLLPTISNQKYNAYLKEIADLCNINKHLTSHIARHTFATTVTLANGISLESVSAMLGHKSIRTTQIYAKVVQSKLSNEMKLLKQKFNPAQEKSLSVATI